MASWTYTGTLDNATHTVGAPQCGPFSLHPNVHYFCTIYLPSISVFAVIVNAYIVYLLTVGAEGRKLLRHTQYVYVLGSAITNLCVATVCNFMAWIGNHMVDCMYLGVTPCFIFNVFNFSGGYQMIINVCLICLDRWRMVRLGAYYVHAQECRRAKWLLVLTSILSVAMFIVPELSATWTVGLNLPTNFVRCRSMQQQAIPQLNDAVLGNYMTWSMIVIPWTIILFTVVLTVRLLWKGKKTQITPAAANAAPSASLATITTTTSPSTKDNKKATRASLVMFGAVASLVTTYGPLAVGLVLLEYDLIGFVTIEVLVYIQFSQPAVDPFAFALTLPKLRAQAKKNLLGKVAMRMWVGIRKCCRHGPPAWTKSTSTLLSTSAGNEISSKNNKAPKLLTNRSKHPKNETGNSIEMRNITVATTTTAHPNAVKQTMST